MCFWRKVFLFSLYYSLANIFSTQAGSNLLLYKLIRWKTFSDVLFKTEVRVLMWERNWRLSIYSKEISHLWGSCSGQCPNRKSNDLCSPEAGLFIRPVYLGLNPRHTWKGCGSAFLWWLTPSCFCAGLVSAGQSVRRLLCALFNNRKDSVVGKKKLISLGAL